MNKRRRRVGGGARGREEVLHRFNMSLSAASDRGFIAYEARVCLH
jgi:hypothetical protein